MMAVSERLQRNAWTDKEGVQPVDLQLIVDQVMSGRTVRPRAVGRRRSGLRATTTGNSLAVQTIWMMSSLSDGRGDPKP